MVFAGLALAAVVLLMVGGGPRLTLAADSPAADPLAGSEWRPVEIRGQAIGNGDKRFIRFGAEGKVTGNGGCNRIFGTAKFEGDGLTLAPLASTRMACPEPVMKAERAFIDALEAAHSFERDRARLVLRDADGQTIMRLAQTDWD
jgi:heat shock protein HslJ